MVNGICALAYFHKMVKVGYGAVNNLAIIIIKIAALGVKGNPYLLPSFGKLLNQGVAEIALGSGYNGKFFAHNISTFLFKCML